MIWQSNPYTIPLLIASIASVCWAVVHRSRYQHWEPARIVAILVLASAIWTLGDALELASANLDSKLLWFRVQTFGGVWISAAWFALALSFTGRSKWLSNRRWMLLAIMPLATIGLALFDRTFPLVFQNMASINIGQSFYLSGQYGPALILFSLYANLLEVIAAILFVQLVRRSPQLHWRHVALIIVCYVILIAMYLVDLDNLSPATQPRLLPLTLLVLIPVAAGLFNRARRADIAPVARQLLIGNLPDPVITLDVEDLILDLNPAAESVFQCSLQETLGYPLLQLSQALAERVASLSPVMNDSFELEFGNDLHQQVFDVTSTTITDRRGQIIGRVLVLRDITQRTMMERDLLLTQFCVDHASIGIMRTGPDARILSVNQQWCQTLGYTVPELCGMHIYDLDPNFPLEHWRAHRQQLRRQGSDTFETIHRRKDGTTFPVEITTNYLSFQKDEFSISFSRDITERKQQEDALRKSEARLRDAQAIAHIGNWDWDLTSNDLHWSDEIYQIFGLDPQAFTLDPAAFLQQIHPDDLENTQQAINSALEGDPYFTEHRIVRPDGKSRYVQQYGRVTFDEHALPIRMFGTTQDITERKQAEDRIQASLKEKEVLLKEIHHRVKNNLQIIASLLNLQSSSIDDPLTLAQFQDSQNRVRSMALIHERLYRSDDLAQIDFGSYLRELAGSLLQTYRRQVQSVTLKVETDVVLLDIDTAIPCGLIVNELVSNALKHGFPNGRMGQVGVEIRLEQEEGQYRLAVWDDGVGFPAGVDHRQTTSLGLQLVNSLTKQIGGSVDLCRESETQFIIRFSRPSKKEAEAST